MGEMGMGKEWVDPTPHNTCPTCLYFLGHVFPDGEELPLPAHPGCECFYVQNDLPGTAVDWGLAPAAARENYVNHAAWLLRNNKPLPPSLEPLRPEAEAKNKERNSMSQFRFNVYGQPGTVDKENHILRDVSVMQTGEALGHRMWIDQVTLNQFAEFANQQPEGVRSRFTHPGLSSSGLGKHLGRVRNIQQGNGRTVGDLYLADSAAVSPDGDLRTYVETRADEDPRSFGMSAVVTGKRFWVLKDGNELAVEGSKPPKNAVRELPSLRVTSVRYVDLVADPATNRGGLFGFSGTTNALAAWAFEYLDKLTEQIGHETAVANLLSFAGGGEIENSELSEFALSTTENLGFDLDRAREFAGHYLLHRQHVPLVADEPKENITMGTVVDVAVDETAVNGNGNAAAWVAKLSQMGKEAVIKNSGLPAPVRKRLLAADYDSPEDLETAAQGAKDELAALAAENVIDLPDRPINAGDMTTALDRVGGYVDWMFGASQVLPPSNMRRLSDLYVAMTGDVGFHGIYNEDNIAFAGANTTDLAGMAANAMNKVIVLQFSRMSAWRWFEMVTAVSPNDGTVQEMAWITLGGIDTLPTVPEKGPYTELELDDAKETDAFVKKGGYVGITLEMIRNSQLAKIQGVPVALANAAIYARSSAISSIFTANSGVGPTLAQDSTALFHANHNNVDTSALDTTAWRAARAECFGHTELGSGKALGFYPKYCLVHGDGYDAALATFGYGDGQPTSYVPEAQARGIDDPRPVPLPVPDWTDSNDWAYVTDPAVSPVIHMSYAQSPGGGIHPYPELFSVASPLAGLNFSNDTMPIKVRDWFAAGVNGPRGIGKRNVA